MGLFFFSRMFSAAIALVTLLALTRVLGPEGFGQFNMAVIAGTAGFGLLFGWLAGAISRFHAAPEFGGKALPMALAATLVAALALAGALVLGVIALREAVGMLALLAGVYCLAHSLHEVGLAGLRVQRNAAGFAVAVVLRPVIGVALAVGLVLAGHGYEAAVLGMSAGGVVMGAAALLFVARHSGLAWPRRAPLAAFLSYGYPLTLVGMGSTVLVLITQGILAGMVGMGAVGTYAAAQTLAMRTITMPMMTLTHVSAPSIFRAHEADGGTESYRMLMRHFSLVLVVSVPLVAVMVLASDFVAGVLFDGAFRHEVARQLPPLSLAAFILGVQGSLFSYMFTISRRTMLQLVITLLTVVVHTAISVAAISGFGAQGAVWAVLASSLVNVAAYQIVGRRYFSVPAPMSEIRQMSVAALALAPFAIAANHAAPQAGLVLVALGVLAFFAALHLQGHAVFAEILHRATRRLPRFRRA